ncbi:MAG: PIN domain-containing protein [Candidatus Bathyarchaeia archaeon]
MKEVIDTRFFIEHFYSEQTETKNKTSKKLRELIKKREGILPVITICEVIQVTCEKRGKEEAKTRYMSLIRSGLQIQDINQDIAKEAGLLKCQYRDMPLGDCIIAAIALLNKAKVLSDDSHFEIMKEIKRTWI